MRLILNQKIAGSSLVEKFSWFYLLPKIIKGGYISCFLRFQINWNVSYLYYIAFNDIFFAKEALVNSRLLYWQKLTLNEPIDIIYAQGRDKSGFRRSKRHGGIGSQWR